MKKYIVALAAFGLFGAGLAQSNTVDFDIYVEGVSELIVESQDPSGGDSFDISYVLDENIVGQNVEFSGSAGFVLRYITNETEENVTVAVDTDVDPKVRVAAKKIYNNKYIRVSWDAQSDLADGLALSLDSSGPCLDLIEGPALTAVYELTGSVGKGDDWSDWEGWGNFDAVRDDYIARMQPNAGTAHSVDVTFDANGNQALVGKADENDYDAIRGVLCGSSAASGLAYEISPVFLDGGIIPQGVYEVTLSFDMIDRL